MCCRAGVPASDWRKGNRSDGECLIHLIVRQYELPLMGELRGVGGQAFEKGRFGEVCRCEGLNGGPETSGRWTGLPN